MAFNLPILFSNSKLNPTRFYPPLTQTCRQNLMGVEIFRLIEDLQKLTVQCAKFYSLDPVDRQCSTDSDMRD